MTEQTQQTTDDRSDRKMLAGVVVSDAMDKTRVIRLERRFRHPLYGKVMTRNTKVYAHDEKNDSKKGDRVSLMETRPMSKLKRWRVVSVLERARVGQNVEVSA
jgi:small subunit ribosomal protein S17